MTRNEAIRQTRQADTLRALGFTSDEAESLRRISMTLRAWHARQCGTDGGCIERDETSGKTFWLSSMTGRRVPIRDMETGAHKRLAAIIATRNARITNDSSPEAERNIHATCHAKIAGVVSVYVQTDPRGCALYILRPGDEVDGADVSSYYSRGIAVY
jgi:hypothetical protein